MSQLALACETDISSRHLSFLGTGRALPSRAMVLRLAERLEVPLRERNLLLVAASYAPVFPERPLDDPALAAACQAVELVLKGHEPYPALAIDRHRAVVAANDALPPACERRRRVAQASGQRPSREPAPRGAGVTDRQSCGLRAHVLERLQRQIELTADPVLVEHRRELVGYPAPRAAASSRPAADRTFAGIAVPFQLATDGGVLSFFSTTTIFGTPIDVTLSELALESFFPADAETAAALRRFAGG